MLDITFPFTEEEKKINVRLGALYNDWSNELKKVWKDYNDTEFEEFGIFPNYLSQNLKILFVGRESRGAGARNYIDILYKAVRHEKTVAGKHINSNPFWRRLLKVAYGINNGCISWDEIPDAATIADTFGETNGLSFAFTNISKLNNEKADEWQSDWSKINTFVDFTEKCSQRYFMNEIEIINPDIIITNNINMCGVNRRYFIWSERYMCPIGDDVDIYCLDLIYKKVPIIDTWHFAAPNKKDNDNFYEPICKAYQYIQEALK